MKMWIQSFVNHMASCSQSERDTHEASIVDFFRRRRVEACRHRRTPGNYCVDCGDGLSLIEDRLSSLSEQGKVSS